MESGHIYGFVGDNGSGKTVLFKVLLGLMKKTSGSILIDDKEMGDFLQDVGFIIERPNYIPYYTAKKNLKILTSYRRKADDKRIEEVLTMFGLDPKDKKQVGKYSLGMKQKLALAMAFLEDPQILILDEPLSALDADSVEQARQQILKEKERGKLILIASHYAEDIRTLCDVVYKMEQGVLNI
jgi:ABC-2 type transport system ATP-binding protein